MTYIQKFFGHLLTIVKHKYWVFHYSLKCGIPWLGLMHDLSKFSPVEFFESVKYFTGHSSPINAAKADKGYSKAWFHHRGRNKHHYEYWVDWLDTGGIPVKMPYKYVLEMICDYLAAARTYAKKEFSYKNELAWWESREEHAKMHDDTKHTVKQIFFFLSITNERFTDNRVFRMIRRGDFKDTYENPTYKELDTLLKTELSNK